MYLITNFFYRQINTCSQTCPDCHLELLVTILGIKYKLVVICSSENEYKSRIVAALDKYHKPQLPIDVQNVRKYLLTKLTGHLL
jgi:hypothetical protein